MLRIKVVFDKVLNVEASLGGGKFFIAFSAALIIGCNAAAAESLWDGEFLRPGVHADFNEVRFGVMAYDRGLFSNDVFSGVVVNGEMVFAAPEALKPFGAPRPYLGFDATIADDPVHFVYGGLNWDFRLTDKFYLSGSVGGAINSAENLKNPTAYKALGCRLSFHLGAAIGYDVTENFTIQAYTDHFSNGNICDPNNGAEASGVRIGYRF